MKTASFHTTARKAILATLQANRDNLRVHDTREWRFLTDEEFRRLGHAKPSDVSYAGDLDDYGMFDGTWQPDGFDSDREGTAADVRGYLSQWTGDNR